MSRSSGPGSPRFFKCGKCRGHAHDVALTGRWKLRAPASHAARGLRNSRFAVEYTCAWCKHTGWSTHVDLGRRAVKEKVIPANELDDVLDHKIVPRLQGGK